MSQGDHLWGGSSVLSIIAFCCPLPLQALPIPVTTSPGVPLLKSVVEPVFETIVYVRPQSLALDS